MGEERLTDRAEYLVLTAAEQRAIDEQAGDAGVPRDALMESAGTSAASWLLDRFGSRRTVVLIGPGGNGGDGLVLARVLHRAGADVEAFIVPLPDRLSPLTRLMYERFTDAGGRARSLEDDLGPLDEVLKRADRVVDALFGTGINRPLGGLYRRIVDEVNSADASVVSLDLPSGLPSDRGALLGEAIRAEVTLAMEFLKPAHLLFPASSYCGDVAVIPISYPPSLIEKLDPFARVLTGLGARRLLPERRPNGHKGTFGRLLIAAGSVGMSGAAILSCRGALRAGAGLVYLATPESLLPIVETALPEAVTVPLPERDGRIAGAPTDRFTDAFERANAIAVGPGLARADDLRKFLAFLFSSHPGPFVVDADAIGLLSPVLLRQLRGRAVLTPHPGELSGLIGRPPAEIDRDRVEVARSFAEENEVVLVLKGRPTVVAIPGGGLYLNPTGNTGLATGGSGDVLTGLIGGFLAGGAPIGDAALLGVYLHGLAAEIYARDRSERSLIPSDLIEVLPRAIEEVERWT